MSRVVLLCLDGGDARIIRQLAADGRLPALGAIVEHGAAVRVDTPGRILDLSVWAPLLAGVPVGDHALAHFEEFDPGTMGTRFRREGTLPALWSHLPQDGAGALVVDPPEIHPHPSSAAAEACGWHGYASPHAAVVTRPELEARLAARGRPPTLENVTEVGPAAERALVDRLEASARFRRGTLAYLGLDRDFTVHGIHELHGTVHGLGHHGPDPHWLAPERRDPELLARVYAAVDAVVAAAVTLAGPDATVVVVAARGIRPADHAGHLLEGLLERAGLLVRRAAAGPAEGAGGRGAWVVERLRGLAPADVRERVAMRVLPERVQQRLAARRFRDHYAWERTQVFPLPTWTSGLIRLNVAGREVAGIVPADHREALLAEIEGLLRETLDAGTGAPLVADVIRPAERWPGRRAGGFPDLVVTWAGGRPARAARHPRLGEWTAVDTAPVWTEHSPEVEVLLAGPGVRGGVVRGGDMLDFAPTVLALAGLASPALPGVPWADVLAT